MNDPTVIRSFIERSLKMADAQYRQVDEDLLVTQVIVEHPPLFFGPPRQEKVVLNLVFRPEAVTQYPGVELVTPGSFRLDWFIDGVRRRGRLTQQSVHWEMNLRRWQREIQPLLPADLPYFFFHHPSLSYRPFLLANVAVSYRTDERTDELYSFGLDLVNGEIRPQLQEALQDKTVSVRLPATGLQKEAIPPAEAIAVCKRYVISKAQEKDPSWSIDAQQRFEVELECLERFFLGENEQADFDRRTREIYLKFKPRIVLSWINLALIYLPEIRYTLQSLDGQELPDVVYYPVDAKLILENSGKK